MNRINSLFEDQELVKRIKTKLPQLFQLAELESSRAGKVGMEVGSVREKIIVALLIYKFGEENVSTEIPITEAEVDVILFNNPISIKTISGKTPSGIKLIWTVDAQKSIEFSQNYINLPKQGTNPRGVEMTGKAMSQLISSPDTLNISINWKKEIINFKPFERWIELWKQE